MNELQRERAEILRAERDRENTARRIRRGWEAALGGRSSLPSPLHYSRRVGGVLQGPISGDSAGATTVGAGLSVTLLRPAAQTIAVGGSALSFTEVSSAARRSGITVTPTTGTITIPRARIVSVFVRFDWVAPWRAGGTVRLLRGSTVVDESPNSWGTRFDGVLHAGLVNAGETLSIEVDHDDGSTHDLENVVAAVKVEGPGFDTITDEPVAGFYSAAIQQGVGISLNRITAGGASESLASGAFTVANNTWYYLRGRIVGEAVLVKAWAAADPEPETWTLSATDSSNPPLEAGYAGVNAGNAASGTRDYDLIEVSHAGAPAVGTDMSGYTTGAGIPTGWERILETSTAWSIVEDAGATGGKVLRHTSDSVGSVIAWTAGGTSEDQEVLVRGRVSTSLGLGISFRGTSVL